jgi:hypothetical protein
MPEPMVITFKEFNSSSNINNFSVIHTSTPHSVKLSIPSVFPSQNAVSIFFFLPPMCALYPKLK